MKKKKLPIIIVSAVIGSLLLAIAIPFSIYGIRSGTIDNNYSYLFKDNKITNKKLDVPLVTQKYSCGYAIIEMLSKYYENPITEEELYNKNNGNISTATTGGFVNEINKSLDDITYTSKEYLKNDKLLLTINESLINDKPVAVEWAAMYEDMWTLHWSVITGMDQEYIYINNPYGYPEQITYDEFISRTTFNAFKGMSLGFHFGFAFGLFSKNTIICAK